MSRYLSISQFRNRFTQEEKRAIYEQAKTIIDVQIWLDDLNAVAVTLDPDDPSIVTSGVDVQNPRLIAGVQGLRALGILTSDQRVTDILSMPEGEHPPVGGFILGQAVRLKPPFSASYPGAYAIQKFGSSSVVLEQGEFDLSYVEAV